MRVSSLGLLGCAALFLASCSPSSSPAPTPAGPYNPDASLVQTTDTRLPYQGTWVMVAQLADGTNRYGVSYITTKQNNTLINAGGGVLGWCRSSDCTANEETGAVIAGSVNVNGKAQLSVGMEPFNSTALRFAMTDDDGIVDIIDGSPVIAGQGAWTVNGKDVAGFFAFVQTSSALTTQALSVQSVTRPSVQVLNTARAALAKLRPVAASEVAARSQATQAAFRQR